MSKKKRRSVRRRKKKSGFLRRNPAIAAIVGIVIILCLVLLIDGYRLQKRIDANNAKTSSLQDEIEAEKERTKSIEAIRDAMSTDSAIEQMAKERLGLVESDEILFKNGDDSSGN